MASSLGKGTPIPVLPGVDYSGPLDMTVPKVPDRPSKKRPRQPKIKPGGPKNTGPINYTSIAKQKEVNPVYKTY